MWSSPSYGRCCTVRRSTTCATCWASTRSTPLRWRGSSSVAKRRARHGLRAGARLLETMLDLCVRHSLSSRVSVVRVGPRAARCGAQCPKTRGRRRRMAASHRMGGLSLD
eukprot:4843183-Prymnesium_polylepis.1